MLYLKPMNLEDARAEYECCQDLPAENGFDTNCSGISYEEFLSLIPRCLAMAEGIGLREGHVPQTYFFLWNEDRPLGVFKLRAYLNESLRCGAGHIGYGICRSMRGQGYATAGLKLALEEAWKIIPEDEVYMSVNKANPASLRVMLHCGAYIHHENEDHYFTRVKKGENVV